MSSEFHKKYDCYSLSSNRMNVICDGRDSDFVSFVSIEDYESAEINLSRTDALDLAWSIIEAFGEGERPARPLGVGDFVKVVSGPSAGCHGRVTKVDSAGPYTSLFVESPGVRGGYVTSTFCERITKDEFVRHINTRVAEIIHE